MNDRSNPRHTRLPSQLPRRPAVGPTDAATFGKPENPATLNTHRTDTVTEPQIVCPSCRTSIKLTESLAAPIVAETRRQFEQQLAAKEADFGKREAALKKTQDELAKAREAIDEQVATKLKAERASIAETEAKKARVALANDLEQRDRQLTELQQNLTANNAKLAEAQAAQAGMLRKERELEDAGRELELTVDRERKTMMRLWAKREEQHKGVLDSTAALYGDLQGIAGRAMQEIESLDVLMIESAKDRVV